MNAPLTLHHSSTLTSATLFLLVSRVNATSCLHHCLCRVNWPLMVNVQPGSSSCMNYPGCNPPAAHLTEVPATAAASLAGSRGMCCFFFRLQFACYKMILSAFPPPKVVCCQTLSQLKQAFVVCSGGEKAQQSDLSSRSTYGQFWATFRFVGR